jgi:aminopeptidase N
VLVLPHLQIFVCVLCVLQDLFNIVAVDDFNMGAMENKSLNIFNSRLVLADPDSATDTDYARIEGVVGHDYLHNLTGVTH